MALIRRSAEVSAGLLAFRRRDGLEVLLAHPGGPFWARKDAGVWTIPKGVAEPGADLLATAKREFTEETNLTAKGDFQALTPVRQKSGKTVHAWALEADFNLDAFGSNTFEIEWPPKSGRRQAFPEIDRIDWFDIATAMVKILTYQQPLLVELQQRVAAKAQRENSGGTVAPCGSGTV
jgi:predicted NUDIX family NTP pyrophosphohydrolase